MLRYLSNFQYVIDNADGFQLRCTLGIPEYGGRLYLQFGALIGSQGSLHVLYTNPRLRKSEHHLSDAVVIPLIQSKLCTYSQ